MSEKMDESIRAWKGSIRAWKGAWKRHGRGIRGGRWDEG
jgi:hypothetical protein